MFPPQPVLHASAAPAQAVVHSPQSSWQRTFVEKILPLLTSISLHAAVLVIGLLAFKAIQVVHTPLQVQVGAATFEISDKPAMLGKVGTADNPMLQTLQDQIKENTDPNGKNFERSSLKSLQAAGGGAEGTDASILSPGPSAFGRGHGLGAGKGSGVGLGEGEGGMAPPFGTPQLGGGPVFRPDPAHRIAFVCDSSGSMITKMSSLKMELYKSVNSLRLTQSFSIIFFQGGPRPDMLSASLLQATPRHKRNAETFLDGIIAASTTDPIPGLDAAFRQQPELIYLLTDGDFPDNARVLSRVRELNKDHKVRVNTIAFVGSSDLDTAFIDLLKTIARENGGTYKHVNEEELAR